MIELVWVGIACGVGALIRYGLTFVNSKVSLPIGTLIGNLFAAFLVGYFTKNISDSVLYRILASGFLGGLGTYSTLNVEFIQLFKNKRDFWCYFLITYIMGLLLVFLGMCV